MQSLLLNLNHPTNVTNIKCQQDIGNSVDKVLGEDISKRNIEGILLFFPVAGANILL
jgi:hypothetical protein